MDDESEYDRAARLRWLSEVDQLPHREISIAEFEQVAIRNGWKKKTIKLLMSGGPPKFYSKVGKESLLVTS
jgi:hypothetical protein